MLLRKNTCMTENNAVKMFQVFHDIARFERADLNLFKYAFNVIQTWETDALQIFCDVAYFLLSVIVGDERSCLRIAN